MAYIVRDGDDDVIHATTHGIMSRGDLSFLKDRVDDAMRTAGGVASKYLSKARDSLAKFDFGLLRDSVEGMRERFGKRWDEDRIQYLTDLSSFQHAKPTNRRIIMAHPRTRLLYQQGRLDGYDGLYEDEEPGAIGRTHTPYREIMHGAFIDNDEGEDHFVNMMGQEDENGETTVSAQNRHASRHNWASQDDMLDHGKQDFTSPERKTL